MQVIGVLEEHGVAGTKTGVISRAIEYDQANVYLIAIVDEHPDASGFRRLIPKLESDQHPTIGRLFTV